MTASVHQTETMLFSVLLQLIVMVAAARVLNTLFRKLGQPGVIGEIVAGLLLGPSLFGHLFPGASLALFGAKTAAPITVISQIGLILLMFQIGMDFEFGHLKKARAGRGAVTVAILSIGAPFALGLLLGRVSAPYLAPSVDPVAYSLFLGVALAITAVPVLGRILQEFGLTRSEIGVVAISAAAINDAVGWLLLAGISAYATAQFSGVIMALQVGGLLALLAALWFAGRPLADWLIARLPLRGGEISPNLLAVVICIIFGLGLCTFKLGVFAVFGGFAAGLLFHRHAAFVAAWRRQVGQLVLVFLMPVFFTLTGLRTNVLGLSTGVDLQWLAMVLAIAVAGKIVPAYVAARLSGFDRSESSMLGVLMNTRGLMELIVLNVGYDLGIIPQKVFTMLVIMAIVTSVMTGPLLKALLAKTAHAVPFGIEA